MREEIVLKVGAGTNPSKLAGSIFKNLEEGKVVKARAFGAPAQLVMAVGTGIAQEFFANSRRSLYAQTELGVEDQHGDPIRVFTTTYFVTDEPLQS